MRPGRAAATLLALGVLSGVVVGNGSSLPGDAVTVEGKLVLVHSDDFAAKQSTYRYALRTSSGLTDLRFRGLSSMPRLGRTVVSGVLDRANRSILVKSLRTTSAAAAAAAPTGTKKVAVILFTFSDNTTQPYTTDYARQVAFTNTDSVAAYYSAVSWGKLTLTGSVFGWYSIPDTSTTCNYTQWATDAESAARAAGVDLSGFDYRVYGFPTVSACGWSGISFMPGTQSWIKGWPGMSVGVMAHELGHAFGLHHANAYSCVQNGTRVALAASGCTSNEYADPFSVMGTAPRGQTNFARQTLDWMPASDSLDVSAGGSYSLQPIESYPSNGVQSIRIARGNGTYLLLEFRQPTVLFDNFPATDPVVNGVTVRVVPAYGTIAQTQLVDTTPATTSFVDAPLTVGRSVTDPVSGATITTVGISSLAASVQVTFGSSSSPPADAPPTAPSALTASAQDATEVRLSWSPSTDDVAVAGYNVYRGGTYVGTSTTTGYTDGGLTPATAYSYGVTALDTAGHESPSSNTATTTTPTAPDTTAPSVPTGLKATAVDIATIGLTWNAATDNVGVTGYRVYRGSTLVATTGSTSFVDTGLKPNTSYSYTVKAVDAAGNVSATSASASAKTTDLIAPTVPSALTATEVDVHRIALSWGASTDNVAVTGYKIYRNGKYLKTVTATSITDGSLTANTTYTYTVTARDAAGNESPASKSASATTLDTTAPTAPVLSARVSNVTDAYVSWTASSDNAGVAGYRVYRNGVLVATTSPGTRSWTDHPAPKGTNTYRVVAFDAAGNATSSNTVSLTF